ncbi:MAG: peptidylprolyl isomerase [Planctomycetes bacterium]|nr:peptidylprolyl isomerase [Planctomycetota bacterium]
MLPKPPRVEFTPGKTYYWELETNKGSIRLRLLQDVAPMHVANVLYLTLLGFYDGLPFHRAVQGFMVQGGCPAGNGHGDPGYRIDLEVSPQARHDRAGMLASANSGPNTDGSQFYITYAPKPYLDGGYTVFGEISEGMAALRALEADSAPPGGGDDKPRAPLVLQKASFSVE